MLSNNIPVVLIFPWHFFRCEPSVLLEDGCQPECLFCIFWKPDDLRVVSAVDFLDFGLAGY